MRFCPAGPKAAVPVSGVLTSPEVLTALAQLRSEGATRAARRRLLALCPRPDGPLFRVQIGFASGRIGEVIRPIASCPTIVRSRDRRGFDVRESHRLGDTIYPPIMAAYGEHLARTLPRADAPALSPDPPISRLLGGTIRWIWA